MEHRSSPAVGASPWLVGDDVLNRRRSPRSGVLVQALLSLFDPSGFPPRWQCGNWSDVHGWVHIIADLGVWSAYLAIPCVLGFYVVRRKDLPFRGIFVLFVLFILACGTTHLMEAVIFWWPAYRLAGAIKVATAVVSWATVFALIPVTPRVLAMRSPEELSREIAARRSAEEALRSTNAELENRVRERTAELERTNAALVLERERLRATLTSIGDAVVTTDTHGRVASLNPVAERLTGWSDAEAAGQPLIDVCHIVDESTEKTIESVAFRCIREASSVDVGDKAVLIARDGRRIPIADSAAPIRAVDGEITGCVLVFHDVSESRAAQEAIRQGADELRALFESTPVAIFKAEDAVGNLITGNRAACDLVDVSSKSNISLAAAHADLGLIPYIVYHEGTPVEIADLPLQRAMRTGEPIRDLDLDLHFPDGKVKHVTFHAIPLRDRDGKIRGGYAMGIDVTSLKRLERELRLQAEQLRQADRRKDEFLATLAHELRNPLAPIRNALYILQHEDVSAAASRDACASMTRQMNNVVRLVDDLLDVSRITRGLLELQKRPVDFCQIVHSAIEASTPLIHLFNHHLHLDLPVGPVFIEADELRIAQVISNLINNSAKYTDPGGNIWLSARADDDFVTLRVRDDGMGISDEMLERVFDMFTQATTTRGRSHGGIGIGLMLVRKLVELHGGTVTAHSDGQGKGSEFVVTLPVGNVRSKPNGSSQQQAADIAPLRILVADDNGDAADSLGEILRLHGHTVHLAYDGEEAMERVHLTAIDVAILDLGMPKLSGYEIAQRIRSRGDVDTLLVALTGWGQDADKEQTRRAGFDVHLVKPVEIETLMRTLARGRRDKSTATPG